MIRYQELPELFVAIDGVLPFRVFIFQSDTFAEGRYQKIYRSRRFPSREFPLRNTAIVQENSFPLGPLSWDVWCGNRKERIVFWKTGFLLFNDESIPVYDFLDRDFLFSSNESSSYNLPAVSNELGASIYRKIRDIRNIMQGQLVNHRIADVSALPDPPPRVPILHATPVIPIHTPTLPHHVLEALVRTGISDARSCPISMTEFSDIREFGITPCYHIFEKTSIETWIATHKNCPECRGPCDTIVTYKK